MTAEEHEMTAEQHEWEAKVLRVREKMQQRAERARGKECRKSGGHVDREVEHATFECAVCGRRHTDFGGYGY